MMKIFRDNPREVRLTQHARAVTLIEVVVPFRSKCSIKLPVLFAREQFEFTLPIVASGVDSVLP